MEGISTKIEEINNEHEKTQDINPNEVLLEDLENNFEEYLIKRFQMEEKETQNFTRLINQWDENDTFYILDKWSEFKLIKNWQETTIKLNKPSIIWETTLLQYLNWQKTSATASVEVKWRYYQISFEKFKKTFEKLDKNEQQSIIKLLKELEEKRKWKTKPIT